MGALQNLINKINLLLEKVIEIIKKPFKKIVPSKIADNIQNFFTNFHTRKKGIKEKIYQKAKTLKEKGITSFKKAKEKKQDLTEKTKGMVNKAKETDWKQFPYKKYLAAYLVYALVPFKKLKTWLLSVSPENFAISVFTLTVGGIGGLVTYKSIQKINKAEEEKTRAQTGKNTTAQEEEKREPTEVPTDEKTGGRPSYYKKFERQFKIRDFTFPVFIENTLSMRTLTIDFSFESSNRYIKEYFSEPQHAHLIPDRLHETMNPVVPTFPLGKEGKNVLKTKIKLELNNLINDLKIKGQIDEVNIDSVMGG